MNSRFSVVVLAVAGLTTASWAQASIDEYLNARKTNGITSVLTSSGFRDFTGSGVFEVRCAIKGFISSRGDTLMVETVDGVKLNVRSLNTPDFLKRTMSLVRLIVKLDRRSLGSDVLAELVTATEDGPVADHDAEIAAAAESKMNRERSHKKGRSTTPSRSSNTSRIGYHGAPSGSPSGSVTLRGPIGGDPDRDQEILSPTPGRATHAGVIDPTQGVETSSVVQPMTVKMATVVGAYATYMQETNSRLDRPTAEEWAKYVIQYSNETGLDARLMLALVTAESDFHWRETSNKGAMGLAQLMPDEVARFGVTNAYDPAQNIRAACHLLREGIDKYKAMGRTEWDSIVLALAGYNAGHGAVKKYGYRVPPYHETQNYVDKITRMYNRFTGMS